MRRGRLVLLTVSGAIAATAVIAWLYRSELVTGYVDDELTARGVRASYDIEQIGLGQQRLRNVVIGDPADPDLVIDRLDLSVALGVTGPYVAAVGIDGARLRGRLVAGKLSFGAVDRLIPQDDGTPPEIPDMMVTLRNARMTMDTPWGRIGMGVQGAGRLTDGFAGNVALRSDRLVLADCAGERLEGNIRLSVSGGVPRVSGPLGAAVLSCANPGSRITDVRLGIDGQLARSLDRMRLAVGVRTGPAGLTGQAGLAAINGQMSLDGRSDGAATMQWEMRGARPVAAPFAGREVMMTGRARRTSGGAVSAEGDVALGGMRLDAAGRRRVADMAQAAMAGSPLDPLVARLASAIDRAGTGGSASIAFRLTAGAGRAISATFGNLRYDAQSGAFIHANRPDVLTLSGDGRNMLSLDARFGGGDLPSGRVTARSAPGRLTALSGQAVIAEYGDSHAKLRLTPIRFAVDGTSRTRFATEVRLSGPLADGRIENLGFALDGVVDQAGNLALSGQCQQLRWDRVSTNAMVIGPAAIPICGQGGQAMLRFGPGGLGGAVVSGPVRLTGALGESPLSLALSSASFAFAGRRLSANELNLAIGTGDAATALSLDSLTGSAATGGDIGGEMRQATGQIGNVPFRFRDIGGNWLWQDGALTINSALTVADAAPDARFQPLRAPDVTLRYAGNRIDVRGTLVEPGTATPVAALSIGHDLGTARGHADIAVDGVTFARGGLQPVMLTRLTLGVIADTEGTVRGRGRVDWSGSDVTSSGRFSTDSLNFAAAFGPVQGLSGTITLSDLINLQTPPGQEARLASVNPGIEVTDGVIRYQLLPGQQVGLESGEWPLAGGRLLLRPTVLDFGVESARRLTFDLEGLDAGLFLSRFEFDNINATGRFDGTIPTIFDANGGRIEDGLLRSRGSGGLAYVGELTYQNLGMFGNLAFGALRSLRYDTLAIRLNGRIDGDMLTEVDFAGLAQGEGVENNIITRAIRRLPVIFRIKINAPFRSLLTSARGLYDPTLLIDQNISALIRAQRDAEQSAATPSAAPAGEPVQPGVSDDG